jgi:hypothetical protein
MPDNQTDEAVGGFFHKKSEYAIALFEHFLNEYKKLGTINLYPTKTMIGIENNNKRVAWITQIGKNFIHIVFPFTRSYDDNLCFTKIAQVPGDAKQFNHHFRMYYKEDVNEEVITFMKMALGQCA